MTTDITRRRFTADEYQRLGQIGTIHEDERVELLDGEIVQMAAVGSKHFACVNRLTDTFAPLANGRFTVSVQNPIRLSPHSEPEPDIVLLRYREDFYEDALPGPEDLLLVIEVADSSVKYDRDVKLRFYAEAGVPEVVIVGLTKSVLTSYRKPISRSYTAVTIYQRGDSFTPELLPDVTISVNSVLGREAGG